jgi:hypothetical protein
MISTILFLIVSLVAYQVAVSASGLWRNVAKAKATGLPYYVVRKCPAESVVTEVLLKLIWPYPALSPMNQLGQLVAPLLYALWRMLPRRYWEDIMPCV